MSSGRCHCCIGLALALIVVGPSVTRAQNRGSTIGGYGEFHYTNPSGPNAPGSATVKRFVIYLGHGFNDRIAFRGELELEDAKLEGGESGGEVALEQAFLDYRLSDAVTLRTGLVLIPVGIINETHEPPTFNGVDRPGFDHDVLPTTWRELGLGAVGRLPWAGGLAYRVYLVNGLVAEGFSAAEGIRGGRQEGRDATFANPSLTGRLEWGSPGLKVGTSFWVGGSANQVPTVGTGLADGMVTLLSADARFDQGGFSARGVAATISMADAPRIRATYGTDVGSRINGGYLEVAYDVLRLLASTSEQRLALFVRHERYNTQAAVPTGVTPDGANTRRTTTFGLTWKPIYNVAFKVDYQLQRPKAGPRRDILAVGAGFSF